MLLRTLRGELISRCTLVTLRFGFAFMRGITQALFILGLLKFIISVQGLITSSILLGIFVSLTNKTS
jgi:hypothetical protein